MPGGCDIGSRPVDIHIDAMNQLGVTSLIEDNRVVFYGENAKSGKVVLSYPSVGATVNAICITAFLEGESTILNAAREPEIVDLCNFLISCGCKINGVGKSCLKITGVSALKKVCVEYQPIKDRIEAGSYMCMSAITAGDLTFEFDDFEHIRAIVNRLKECGVAITQNKKEIRLRSNTHIKPFFLVADVYPAFPTDMQSLFIALATKSRGVSVVEDKVFSNRFAVCSELRKMGAKIITEKGRAIIEGGALLKGKSVNSTDLRAGAALICAALSVDGETEICNSKIISRGYEDFVEKLTLLGAKIKVKV